MGQLLLELPLHRSAVDDKRVDDVLMTGRQVVVVIAVAVKNLNHRASAVERRRHGELQQIISEEDAVACRNGGTQSAQDCVKVFNRRLELEAGLVVGVEVTRERRIHPERIVRKDGGIAESVRAPMPEDPFDDVQGSAKLVGNHTDNAR